MRYMIRFIDVTSKEIDNSIKLLDNKISYVNAEFGIELKSYGNILRIAINAIQPDTIENLIERLKINKELGITILLITHEMNVIQRICDCVAVMENGEIIEEGRTKDIFTSPQHSTTKRFVNSLFSHDIPDDLLEELSESGQVATLSFFGESSGDPALALVTKKYDIFPNILSGNITRLKDEAFGQLLVHFKGDTAEINKAIQFLQEKQVHVEGVTLNERHQRIS